MQPPSVPSYSSGLVWFRRDLRIDDQAALYHALTQCQQVHCAFVFDRDILDPLPRKDRRVEFIRESLVELDAALRGLAVHEGAGLIVVHAVAAEAIADLSQTLGVQAVFANHDDEPQALERDSTVRTRLAAQGRAFHTFKDHTVLERNEVLTQAGNPYSVFTPYKNAWLKKINAFYLSSYLVERYAARLAPRPEGLCLPVPTLEALGFLPTELAQLQIPVGSHGAHQLLEDFLKRIDRYDDARNFPAIKGPSYLSVHLRFGTLSPRLLARTALERVQQGSPGAATWLGELIWRDFYFQILYHHPHVVEQSFKPAYDNIPWETGPEADELFAAWCEGRTGYPLVDAAMAQINQTGYMHNRLRMVVASFL
ncbi:MAG: deoxyribodipyrimidine photo-lyase, partial [Comamonadaceae bacterium]